MTEPALGDINVVCTDVERSLAFYRDALGLREIEREGGAVRLGLRGGTVLLLPFATVPRRSADYPEEATIAFDVLVDDVATTVAQVERAGGSRVAELGAGLGWAVRDPDGNVIEIIERTGG